MRMQGVDARDRPRAIVHADRCMGRMGQAEVLQLMHRSPGKER